MAKRKKTIARKQKKMFAKTAGNEGVKSINGRPSPQRGGFRL